MFEWARRLVAWVRSLCGWGSPRPTPQEEQKTQEYRRRLQVLAELHAADYGLRASETSAVTTDIRKDVTTMATKKKSTKKAPAKKATKKKAAKKGKSRSAETGKYVSGTYASTHKSTTVRESK
jgi:hypothetical protein